MADLADVSSALVTLIAGGLYPNGTSQPSAVGANIRIFAGWPKPAALDSDLAAGIVNVSVYPEPNMTRITTRYPRQWQDQVRGVPTITAAISGRSITLGGAVTIGQYVTILVNEKAYSYAALAGNTLSDMAAALAALIAVDYAGTTASGAAIALAAVAEGLATVRIGAPGTIIREVARQDQAYKVTVWAPNDTLRVACCRVIIPILYATDFLGLPDLTQAWVRPRMEADGDQAENQGLYRRDIGLWAEYATTQVDTGYPITAFGVGTQGQNTAGDLGPTVTTNS